MLCGSWPVRLTVLPRSSASKGARGARTRAQYHLVFTQAPAKRQGRRGGTGSFACQFNKRRQAEPPVLPLVLSDSGKTKWLLRIRAHRVGTHADALFASDQEVSRKSLTRHA